ncbi:3-oxoacyl-ACP synthase [bacterium]|nr:3-oxoacyl-ACP synthase [bacterium]
MNKITKTVAITSSGVSVDGNKLIANSENLPFGKLCRKIYKEEKINYPKFYKMDGMSKLGFLAAEILLANSDLLSRYDAKRVGVITTTQTGCFETDKKFSKTIEKSDEWYPAPALFVYTLPNIVTGEICIRHKIEGENCCFVHEKSDPEGVVNYTTHLFDDNKIDAAVVGIIEQREESYFALLYTVERGGKESESDFTTKTLKIEWRKKCEN